MADLHVDGPLTDLSVRFSQSADNFIADKVFPRVPVRHRSDQYYTYDRSFWQRSDAQLRGPGAESAGSGFEVGTASFSCDVVAIHKDLDDQTRANADSQFNLEADATEFCTQHILQYKEQAFVSTYFTTGVWTTDVVGGTNFTQWSDYASSNPIEDLRLGVTTMAELTAYKPNTLIMGPNVMQKLTDHPDFLDRVKWSQKGVVTEDLLASLIGIDRVFTAWSVRNTANEGATASYSFNFGDNALLLYVPSSPGLNTPAAGYTFTWTGLMGQGSNGMRIKRFRMEQNAADRIEAETAFSQVVVSADLGYFFSAAVA
jgi:hypothetical protein